MLLAPSSQSTITFILIANIMRHCYEYETKRIEIDRLAHM